MHHCHKTFHHCHHHREGSPLPEHQVRPVSFSITFFMTFINYKRLLILIHTCDQSSSYVNLHVNIAILSGFQSATKNLWALLMDHWMEAFTHQRWSIPKEIHDSVFIHFLQGHVSVSNWFSRHLVSGESRLSESLFSSFYSVITFIFDAPGFAIQLLSPTD